MRDEWEDCFEARYGFWRPLTDRAVAAFLDCGILENGFARVRCGTCATEYLVAFSCKCRGLCPSCAAKRGAELAAFLREEVLQEVGHAQWEFSLPKKLCPGFLYHRPLLGRLCRAAYEAVPELMVEAAAEPALESGMIAVMVLHDGTATSGVDAAAAMAARVQPGNQDIGPVVASPGLTDSAPPDGSCIFVEAQTERTWP